MIYLCEIDGLPFLKVGYSENPEKRYVILDGASPFTVRMVAERNGSRLLEKEVHKMCRKFLVKNEWYIRSEEVIHAFFSAFDPEPRGVNSLEIYKIRRREKMEHRLAFGGLHASEQNALSAKLAAYLKGQGE